jgi:hypothetical protein
MTYVATWPALVAAGIARFVRRLVEAARRAGVTPMGVDLALAVVSLVAMLIERVGATAVIGAKMPLAVSLSVVIAAGLALRRRAPLCGYLLGSLALAAESLLVASSPISPYPNLIGIYSLGLYAARGRATVTAVNSALQRARAALADAGGVGEVSEPDDPPVREVVQRYVRAFEAADVPALVRLLTDEVVLEMPPVPLWYRGSRDYGRFMRRVFQMRGAGWRMSCLTANGQPALAAYAPGPGGGHLLHTLQVLTVGGGQVTHNVVFADPRIFEAFSLPAQLV